MRWFLALMLCVCCLGCDKDDKSTNGNNEPTYIYPLAIGNYWLTETIYYNQQGVETSRDTLEATVARDTVVEGQRWYQFASDSVLMQGWAINRLGGFWTGLNPQYLEYMYPTEEDVQYNTGGQRDVILVENVSDTIQVSAGQFCCISYKKSFSGTSAFNRAKLAPGVGPVLNEFWQEGNDQLYLYSRTTLLQYLVQ